MGSGDLKNDQKDLVWRYAHCAGLWRRKQGRNFASLESDMRAGYAIVADGIAIEARHGHPVIITDAKDTAFFAAIFKNDDGATPEMRALYLERLCWVHYWRSGRCTHGAYEGFGIVIC